MANEIIRYCQSGHEFHIVGEMAVGNTITVTVVPLPGYTFVGWKDGNTDNPRDITIDECGITYVGMFEPIPSSDLLDIFERLSIILDGPNNSDVYVESSITEAIIETQLSAIIG